MAFQKEDYVSNGVMTGTAVITGGWICTRGLKKVSFQNVWTGTPNGTFSYEGTDSRFVVDNPSDSRITATPLTTSVVHGTAAPAGAAGNNIIILADMPLWIRQKYTNSSSTGTLNTSADGDAR